MAEGSSPGPAPRRDDGAGVDGDAGGASLRARAPPDADARASASPARPDQSALFDVLAELARATRGSSSDEVKASQRLVEDALLRVTCGGWAGPAVRRAAADVLARLFPAGNPVSLYSCLITPPPPCAAATCGEAAGEDLLPSGFRPPRRSLPAGAASVGRGGVPRAPRGVASVARRRDERIRARPRERAADLAADARLRRRHLQTPRRGRGRLDAAKFGTKRGARVLRVAAIRLVGAATGACARDRPPAAETRRVARGSPRRRSRKPPPRDPDPPSGTGARLRLARAPVQHDRRPDRRVRVRVGARGRAGGVQGVTDPPGTGGVEPGARGAATRGGATRGGATPGLERAFPRSIPNASAGAELASLLVRCLEDADEDARRAASDALGKLAASRVAALVAAADQSDQSGGGGGDSGDSGFGGGAASPLGLARSGSGSGGSGSTSVFGAMFGGSGSSGQKNGRDAKAERAKALAAEATEAARANARIAFAPLDLHHRVAATAWVETQALVFAAPFVRGARRGGGGIERDRKRSTGGGPERFFSSRDARARAGVAEAWAGALRAMEARSVGRRARKSARRRRPRRSRRAPSTPPWTRRGRRREAILPPPNRTRIGARCTSFARAP